MKRLLTFISLATIISITSSQAQEQSLDGAALFNGKVQPPMTDYVESRYLRDRGFVERDEWGDQIFPRQQAPYETYAKGNLFYDGVKYEGVEMRLDLYRDQFMVWGVQGPISGTILDPERFGWADLRGYHIIRAMDGYYIQLYDGSHDVLRKEIFEFNTTWSEFTSHKVRYYVEKNGSYHRVLPRKGSVLRLLSDYRGELDRFIRANGIEVRRNPDDAIVQIVQQYDKLVGPLAVPAIENPSIELPSGETPFGSTSIEQAAALLDQDRPLATSLPDFHYSTGDPSVLTTEEASVGTFALDRPQQVGADSQLRLYEVGDSQAYPTGRISLSGYVYDNLTGKAVPGLILQIGETNTYTVTDGYGYYRFQLAPGRYEINLTGAGQMDSKRLVQLYSEGTLNIISSERINTMTEIAVYGNRRDNVRQTAVGMERLRVTEIKNMPMAFGELDILKVVTSLPGVKAAGEVSSGFNVRGGATDQNLILYNDGTVFNPTHLFGLFSAFNPDIVRDMELYKSSIPAKFGGRISSVLDIHNREGNKKEFAGSASIGLLTSRIALEGPIWKDRTSFIVGGRATYSDWLLNTLPANSDYKDGKAGFWDANATLSHRFNDHNNLFVDGYYSQDRFSFEEFENYKYHNGNASLKWRHIFNTRLFGVFSAGYDHYDHTIRNVENPWSAYELGFGIDQLFGKADLTLQLNGGHSLNFGLNVLHYDLQAGSYLPFGENSTVPPDRLPHERAIESALYISDKWTISHRFEVDYGIRYSMFNTLYHGPEFRLSARYSILDDLSIKAGVNSLRQYIHKISNNTVMSPTDTWKLSDQNIKPQRGIQYAMGLFKDFRNQFIEISLEGYYKTMNDYLDYRNGAQLIMNDHLENDVVSTRGRAYGIELMVRRTEGKLNGWASYTYSRTELRQDDPSIPLPVNNGDWYPTDFDKPHEIKVVGNYRFTHRLSISLNAEYATGRPITLPVAKYNYAGGEYLYYSDRNKYRVSDYFRLDMSINIEPSHHLTLLTHSMLTFGVYNVTGRKNAHSVYFKQENGKVKGYKLSIFGVPIPYVSYNIKF